MTHTPAEQRYTGGEAEEDAIPEYCIDELELSPADMQTDRLAHLLLTAWVMVLESERDWG